MLNDASAFIMQVDELVGCDVVRVRERTDGASEFVPTNGWQACSKLDCQCPSFRPRDNWPGNVCVCGHHMQEHH